MNCFYIKLNILKVFTYGHSCVFGFFFLNALCYFFLQEQILISLKLNLREIRFRIKFPEINDEFL